MKRLKRVFRGGSWGAYQAYCRVAFRDCYNPDNRFGLVGFRLVGVKDEVS